MTEHTTTTAPHTRINWSGWLVRVAVIGSLLLTYVVITAQDRSAFGETGGTTSLVEIDPFRLVDTRLDVGFQRLDSNTIRVQVDGVKGMPSGAEAVSVSIAATGATAAGYVMAYPAGGNRELSSNLNYEPGQTLSSGAVIPLNRSGAFDIYTLTPVDIVVDVTGVFVATTAARSGRFVALAPPSRLLDTRNSSPMGAGETMSIGLPSSVPDDAMAAIVTLTSTLPNAAGYFTAFADGPRPATATLNVSMANSTRGTTAIIAISKRSMNVYSSRGGNLVVDLVGYFTGPSAAQSSKGLFVPTTPQRRLDTRDSLPMLAGEARSFKGAEGGIALGALTMVGQGRIGHAVTYANGTERPETSSINLSSAQMITNLTVSRVSKAGVSLYSATDAHYVFDQFGYFVTDLAEIVRPLDSDKPAPRPAQTRQRACGVSELLVPSCGVWFGASTPSRNGGFDYVKGLAEYEAVAQNTPDILHFYKTGAQKFPTSEEVAMSERSGRQRSLLLYNWKPSKSVTWRQIADGRVDGDIAFVASNLKKYPRKLFLTIYHEPEDNVKPAAGSGMTPKDYADMYRHVVDVLRANGVDNVVYVWNVMGYEGWEKYLDGLYPGNGYVDWIGYDPYAQRNTHKNLEDLVNRPRPDLGWPGFYKWADAKAPGKPMMWAEWGVDLKSNSNPASVLAGDAAATLNKYPSLKALVFWNDIDNNWNVRIDDHAGLGAAFRKLAAQPIFNQASPNDAP